MQEWILPWQKEQVSYNYWMVFIYILLSWVLSAAEQGNCRGCYGVEGSCRAGCFTRGHCQAKNTAEIAVVKKDAMEAAAERACAKADEDG
eukprot:4816148-Ditylum_brightwellii.AAC.1